ncbi:hypothetical protein AX774_g2157 [Zancudomyces culisetae]|uniref:Uncharacterized protein n=1 Tax=Zancudomyces culisetae TaxID=1213189 RepID=A0A1R1PTK4_ZANCU|nr:hypothetical protein AX774_g2157 [Zancudomyces culisetae]|eukprot:OMH84326.1 hypothetical protein AX774_g2157 [Zancudomyces culisetae]
MRFNSQLNEANTNGLQLYKEVNNGMMRGRVDYTSPRISNKADRYMDETANLKRLSGLNGDFNFFQTEYNDINRLQNELVNSNILPEPTPRRDNNIHPVDMNSGFSLPAFNTLFSSMDFVQGSEKDFRAQKSSGDFGFASGVYPPNPIRFYDCCSTKKLGISQGAGDDFSSYTKQYKYYPLTNKPQVHLSISSCELSNGCCCTRGTCSSNKDSRCAGKTHNSNPYNGSAASQCGCSCSQNKSSKLKSVKDADGAINCGCGCKKPIMECTDCVKDMCEEALLCPTI